MGSTTLGSLPYARLDKKSRRRVLCGAHPACRADLAEVSIFSSEELNSRIGYEVADPDHFIPPSRLEAGRQWRLVVFAPGWIKGQTDAWYLSKRAKEQTRKGYRPYRRKPLEVMGGTIWEVASDRPMPLVHLILRLCDYPARAVCPDCGREQIIDADRLELSVAELQMLLAKRYSSDDYDPMDVDELSLLIEETMLVGQWVRPVFD